MLAPISLSHLLIYYIHIVKKRATCLSSLLTKVDDVSINESEVNFVSNENAGYIVERREYKGKPILVIKRDENDKYPFSFGISKAKLILDNLEEIKKFVEENSG